MGGNFGAPESSWLTTDGFFVRWVRCVRQWAARMASMEPEKKESHLLVVGLLRERTWCLGPGD